MKISITSIIISISGLVLTIIVNYEMSIQYHLVDGKTQAFFGLGFLYRYYYVIFGIVGLVISIVAGFKNESRKLVTVAFIVSLISILAVSMNIWRYMI